MWCYKYISKCIIFSSLGERLDSEVGKLSTYRACVSPASAYDAQVDSADSDEGSLTIAEMQEGTDSEKYRLTENTDVSFIKHISFSFVIIRIKNIKTKRTLI